MILHKLLHIRNELHSILSFFIEIADKIDKNVSLILYLFNVFINVFSKWIIFRLRNFEILIKYFVFNFYKLLLICLTNLEQNISQFRHIRCFVLCFIRCFIRIKYHLWFNFELVIVFYKQPNILKCLTFFLLILF
jgi:hypothetical protein